MWCRIVSSACFLICTSYGTPGSGALFYVDLNCASPEPPYSDWSTAATNIQDAVDLAGAGDQVLVTNGVYSVGGRLASGDATLSRVVVAAGVVLQSVNGPAVTVIEGYQVPGRTNWDGAVRCVYLVNGAALIGFTLTNGATQATSGIGGGVCFQTVFLHTTSFISNCIVIHNAADAYGGGVSGPGTVLKSVIASNWARLGAGGASGSVLVSCQITGNSTSGDGGGSNGGVLTNSLLVGNSAGAYGGGSYGEKLYNCTIVGNYCATLGGGVDNATFAANCIVYDNDNGAPDFANYYDAPMAYSCTTPLPAGSGNFTNEPLFVDLTNGNFHLQPGSPCINAGNNAYVRTSSDLDGSPRNIGGAVDLGAYEFQSPGFTLPFLWAQLYQLPTDGSVDTDGDGMNNWQEWVAGTNPTNASSVLKILNPATESSGLTVSWESVSGKTYYLQRSTDPTFPPPATFVQSNIVGQAATTVFTDTNTVGAGPYFYRVGIQQR